MSALFEVNSGRLIAEKVMFADTFFKRLVGLLRHKDLPSNEALWIPRCNAIHTVGMKFSIDAIFVDRAGKVLGLYKNIKPYRFAGPVWGAFGVYELRGLSVPESLQLGSFLQVGEL